MSVIFYSQPLLVVVAANLVIGAEKLQQVIVGRDRRCHRVREWLRVRFRIINRRFNLQVSRINPTEALGQTQRFGMRMACKVQPGQIGKSGRLDNEFVVIPPAGRIAQPARQRILHGCTTVEKYLPKDRVLLVENNDEVGRLDDLVR